jgi:dTDP-4-dehydrorhamnose reductase
MKVLITGANGMVARSAAKHCRFIGDDVITLTRQQCDIADIDHVRSLVLDHQPNVIINCAAYTNVDGAESEQGKAVAANSRGVLNLAMASREVNARFITISTDYVFDGTRADFYTQRDQPNPQGVYAKSKYYGELTAIEAYARSIIVRSGWIFGDGGTNFLSVMHKLLAEGKPIKAIKDSYGTPTFADDLARRLRELAELDMPTIFHIVNSGPGTSYLGFAEKVCEVGGFDKNLIEAVSKDDLKRPARRPTNSKLACLFSERLGLPPMPDWEEALERFLKSSEYLAITT